MRPDCYHGNTDEDGQTAICFNIGCPDLGERQEICGRCELLFIELLNFNNGCQVICYQVVI